jgi:HD-like signal output (HDOD) protein
MTATDNSNLLHDLFNAIENNQLPLPAMPDLAIKINQMLNDINVSTQKIAVVVATDPVLASQIVKTANSALYLGKPRADTVTAAVTRIGFQMLKNIIVTFTMNKISNSTHPVVKKYIAEFWEHSREVAAISYVLAKNQKHLVQEEAMLAGLVHDIGTLPLCLYAEKMVPVLDEATLKILVTNFKATIGNKLLMDWKFPPELTAVVLDHENLQLETNNPNASYSDIVTVANLLNPSTAKSVDWENIAAVKRLHYDKETCQAFFAIFDNQLRAAHALFK